MDHRDPTHRRPVGWDETAAAVDADDAAALTETDLDLDPAAEAEVLCLCSLTTRATAQVVVDALVADDFTDPIHAALFEVITTQVRAGRPQDPTSISATLTEAGQAGGHHGMLLCRTLTAVTTAAAERSAARHYASLVLTAAYRRSFHTAAQSMAQAATELAQEQLFEHLLTIGRAQRAARTRLITTLPTLRAADHRW